ncbi:MAG: toxic anion resistance protein [Clostridiales bacterium]|nr:toxic anion resistance protein [Clostridiales bacterium]
MDNEIKLTFGTPEPGVLNEPIEGVKRDIEDIKATLSPAELATVEEFASRIDIRNSNMILQYGAEAQKKIANFSDSSLDKVRTKDLGEIGNMMSNLVLELKDFSPKEEEKKGIRGFFKRVASGAAALKVRYEKAEVNVDKICGMLEDHQVQLLKDIAVLDKLYDMNLSYFKEMSMYILAGKKRLEEIRATELISLREKAANSGLTEDAQAANDLANLCDRFEKKLYDLELTRNISIQMAPQIRLIQNNNSLMAEKIQSTIVNTIPLWKNQMVLALGMEHSRQAMEAQRSVTDMTNELLKKNAEALKQGTLETAKESQRGIVDIETLTYTNQTLITTIDEMLRINAEGKEKRYAAEAELGRIEDELKRKLLEQRNG